MKQALNHPLAMKKVIEFNKEASLKPYIYMNTELRKTAKNDFQEKVFKLMINADFGKTMGNVRKHRDIKLILTEAKRNYFLTEPNYHTIKVLSDNLLSMEMKKDR